MLLRSVVDDARTMVLVQLPAPTMFPPVQMKPPPPSPAAAPGEATVLKSYSTTICAEAVVAVFGMALPPVAVVDEVVDVETCALNVPGPTNPAREPLTFTVALGPAVGLGLIPRVAPGANAMGPVLKLLF